MTLKHGWDVPLKCLGCGYEGNPEYQGWTPSMEMTFGSQAKIYANLVCPECKKTLKEEAGQKLAELFSEIKVPSVNKKIMVGFILFLISPILFGIIFGFKGFLIFLPMLILLGPAIMFLNYRIASIRYQCECGKPDYIFMGLLGRSYCHRCANCGKLLRLRD